MRGGGIEELKAHGTSKIVITFPASRFSKSNFVSLNERNTYQKKADVEAKFFAWREDNAIDCVILRPTLIFGRGSYNKISEIVGMIQRLATCSRTSRWSVDGGSQ